MRQSAMKSEIAELMHNASLGKIERMAHDLEIKPLLDAYVASKFDGLTIHDLDMQQLKDLVQFVEGFMTAARSAGKEQGDA